MARENTSHFFPKSPDGSKGVSVGSPIAIIGEEGDDLSGANAPASEASKPQPEPTKAEEKAPEPKQTPKEEPKPTPTSSKAELPTGDTIFATPIAKKIALERGIPLAKVKGTGTNGRILREDVEKFKPSTKSIGTSTSQPVATTYSRIHRYSFDKHGVYDRFASRRGQTRSTPLRRLLKRIKALS